MPNSTSCASSAPALTGDVLELHRPAVAAVCRRMLGPGPRSEDAVQETLLRAWRRGHQFHGRAPLGAWLRRIARNVCLDEIELTARGPHAVGDLAWARGGDEDRSRSAARFRDGDLDEAGDPALLAERRESVRLACAVALRVLPPRQRAALFLCAVLRTSAGEAASLMGTSTTSVNSLLQRARASLLAAGAIPEAVDPDLGAERRALLARYVAALTTGDAEGLVALVLEELGRPMATEAPALLAA